MITCNVLQLAMRVAAALVMVSASALPLRAAAATKWTVIVGGHPADNSVYANGFYPRELTVQVGDTVTWQFEGFHNVTFLSGATPPQFAIKDGHKMYANPKVFFPAGGKTYNGVGFRNSGTPQGDKPFSYSLTFTKPGHYEYACTIHAGMAGVVNVVRDPVAGTPAAALERGRAEQAASLAAATSAYEGLNAERNGSNITVRLVGNHEGRYSILRFTRKPLLISVGTTITWIVNDPFEIHTVTFTNGDKHLQFIIPEPQPNGPPQLELNAAVLTPTKRTSYDGTGYVNSGLLFPAGNPAHLPSSFSLTFTKPGRYEYWCLVHKDAGQRGIIIVK
jgi:plastocyanin